MVELTYRYLYEQYVVKKRTLRDIAKEHSVYPSTIMRKLDKFGIKTNSPSEAKKISFEKGRSVSRKKGKE